MLKEYKGNLLNSKAKYIVHQCNCVIKSGKASGLAYSVFKEFPYANTYTPDHNRKPGTIDVLGDGKDQRFIINLYGQFLPGGPSAKETEEQRVEYFIAALKEVLKIENIESIAFPKLIGCAIAGGDWDVYYNIISKFAKKLGDQVEVEIVDFDENVPFIKPKKQDVAEPVKPSVKPNDQFQKLVDRCKQSVKESGNALTDQEKDRLKSELKFASENKKLIEDVDYFFSNDLFGGEKNEVNSLLFYVLGITKKYPDLDREFSFSYELDRTETRISDPDVDIDFEYRESVLEYLCKKYGKQNVALVGTANTYKPKAAIQFVAKALDVTKTQTPNMKKFTPENDREGKRLSKILINVPKVGLKQWLGEDPKFSPPNRRIIESMSLIQDERRKNPKLFEMAKRLEGLNRSYGTHAAGVVISDELLNLSPLHPAKQVIVPGGYGVKREEIKLDMMTTQYDKDDVEYVKLLKFDFLQIATLRHIRLAMEMIYERHKIDPVDFNKMKLNDPKVFKTIDDCLLEGLFQISGEAFKGKEYVITDRETGEVVLDEDGQKKTRPSKGVIKVIGCNSFADIVASNALGRPGPMMCSMHNKYAEAKKTGEFNYAHPSLESILKPTYGQLIYQEQLTAMAQTLAGWNYGKADKLRKACAKKDGELLRELESSFKENCKKRNLSNQLIDEMWNIAVQFGEYAFNKSHACLYAHITYITAWIKTYYPVEFICAVLTAEADSSDEDYLKSENSFKKEYKKLEIVPPNVCESKKSFYPIGKMKIIAPFFAIKGIGHRVSNEIVKQQPYLTVEDFYHKVDRGVVSDKVIDTLIDMDAFFKFGTKDEVKRKIMVVSKLSSLASKKQKQSVATTNTLF